MLKHFRKDAQFLLPRFHLKPSLRSTYSSTIPSMSTRTIKNRPIRLVLDFDGTISKTDTLKSLAQIGYAHAARSLPSRKLTPWSEIVSAYMTDYEKHESSYSPRHNDRRTLEQEREWLNSLLPIERASAARAVNAGIWDGVNREEIMAAAEARTRSGEVQLREGWQALVCRVVEAEGTVDVVSVNWSRWWIWSLLRAGWRQWRDSNGSEGEYGEYDALDKVALFANELPHLGKEQLPLGEDTELRTSGDKLRCMRRGRTGDQRNEEANPFVIYVGDSATDLECLVEADLGICVRGKKSLTSSQRELAGTLDGLVDLQDFERVIAGHNAGTPYVTAATDFVEIERLVFNNLVD